MRKSLAAALVLACAAVSLQWANAQESGVDGASAEPMQVVTPQAATRVRMAFTVQNFQPMTARRDERVEAMKPRPVSAEAQEPAPAAKAPSRPWYAMDQSLQRGDIVVRDGDALVYEGVRNGKRHFRTVAMSRLVSGEERERILNSVRR